MCHEKHPTHAGFNLLDFEMFQTRKKASRSDWWCKEKVKQTNLWRKVPYTSSLLYSISHAAEAGLTYMDTVKSKGPVLLSTSANCITQWCGWAWTNLFLQHLAFLGLLPWFEQIILCVLLIKLVRIRAFLFSFSSALESCMAFDTVKEMCWFLQLLSAWSSAVIS